MDFREVLNLIVVLCWLKCVCGNDGIPILQCKSSAPKSNFIAANSGENSETNGYNVLHDFNFPDVTYPTSLLDTCQPFYFYSNSNGLDSIVGPFSSDVKSNYKSLLSNENKAKDEMSLTTNKSIVMGNIDYSNLMTNEENAFEDESEDTLKLKTLRNRLKKFREKSSIDPELEDILSVLNSEPKESEYFNIDKFDMSDIKPTENLEDIEHNIDEIQPVDDTMECCADLTNSSIDELKSASINDDMDYNTYIINSTVRENIYEGIINNELHQDLVEQSYEHEINVPESMIENIDAFSNVNNSYILEKSEEPINDDICYLQENNSNYFTCDVKEVDPTRPDISSVTDSSFNGYLSDIVIKDNRSYFISNNSAQEDSVPELEGTTLSSYIDNQNIIEPIPEDELIKLDNFTVDENDQDLTDIDDGDMINPKDPVVFDVVYKDGHNLEKPVLDIVPSNLPVRLKINIEICKHDSNEIDDLNMPELNDEQQTFNSIGNEIDLEDLNNSVPNIEESELAQQEQITVLDEINDSDFISALSILLLDSLNNKPLEILPSDIINAESDSHTVMCDSILGCSIQYVGGEHFTENSKSTNESIEVPDYSSDSLTEKAEEYKNTNEVKIINTSPLIDILSPIINIDHIQETNNVDDISDGPYINFKADCKEYEDQNKTENVETPSLLHCYVNITDGNTSHLVEGILSPSKQIPTIENSVTKLNAENKEYELLNYPHTTNTWPLVNVFQLKIKEDIPVIKDISEEKLDYHVDH